MKSRKFFVLRGSLLVAGAVLVILLAIFLVSSVVFAIRSNGLWMLPSFGSYGMYEFLRSLPWLIMLVAAGILVVLEYVSWHYTSVYRQPVLYSTLAVIFGVLVLAIVVDYSHLTEYVGEHNVPLLRPVYTHAAAYRPHNAYFVTLITTGTMAWEVEDEQGETIHVLFASSTPVYSAGAFMPFDHIMIIGTRDDHQIVSRGVRKIDDRSAPSFVHFVAAPSH